MTVVIIPVVYADYRYAETMFALICDLEVYVLYVLASLAFFAVVIVTS